VRLVVDATAIIAILTHDTTIDQLLAKATDIIAPDFAVVEVLNVRWKYRRASLAAPGLEPILAFFDRITIVSSRAYAFEADELSAELDHPIYDCLYAAVARREDGKLLTADRRFARKLEGRLDVAVF